MVGGARYGYEWVVALWPTPEDADGFVVEWQISLEPIDFIDLSADAPAVEGRLAEQVQEQVEVAAPSGA